MKVGRIWSGLKITSSLPATRAEPSARVPATKGALGAGGYGTARGDVGVVAFDLRLASLDPGHPERVAHEHLAQQELGAAAHVGNAASSNKTSAPRHTLGRRRNRNAPVARKLWESHVERRPRQPTPQEDGDGDEDRGRCCTGEVDALAIETQIARGSANLVECV